ncbi:MAG: endonuclease III [Lachnospiraceae bacterium]|nr:endonuclease III [Lachnospiraceae bacterium]
MTEQERIARILGRLDEAYGTDSHTYLEYGNAWQLLVATILSAQCTDARVNLVTQDLFRKYDSLEKFAAARQEELEQDIYSTGFYHHKAKNIIACAQALLERHGGEVPSDIESLTALPGVGRKTANVVRGNVYGVPSIVVDTHVGRIARRLGLSANDDPVKVEFDLMEKIPEDHWILINLHLIALGRSICKSQRPDCEACFLKEECPSRGKASGSGKGAGKAGKASAKAGKKAGNASAKAPAWKKSPAE